MPSKNTTIAAVTLAGLTGLGAAAALDASSTPADPGAAAGSPPPQVRTEVVTQTIHRVRRIRVHPHRPVAAAAPATLPVAGAPPAPAPRPAPVRTRSSGAGSGRGADDHDENEHDRGQRGHEIEDEGGDD